MSLSEALSPTVRPRIPRPTKGDAVAGASVALVLVPQSIAYAVLAGMPPAAGLAAAVAATTVAAPFVSSPYLQTGPVAITAMLTFGALASLARPGDPEYVALAALLALLVGIVRLAIGASRAGVIAYLMSQPVLAGFMPAAAIVIAVSQLPAALGIAVDGRGPATILPALVDVGAWDLHTLGLAAASAAVMVTTRRLHPLFPSVLAAIVIGLVGAIATGYDGALVGDIPGGLPRIVLDLPWAQTPHLVVGAVVIALVGFAEASAISRTFARETRTRWDADREFVSQGVANIATGLVGTFPVGGSFSRSAVARRAGASTAWSGAFTGLVVLAAMPLIGAVERLPTAVLAAVIIVAVAKLIDPRELLRLRTLSRQQFTIGAITFALALALAPQIQYGVVIGVLLSVGAHLRRELSVATPSWLEGDTLHVRPLGVLFFGSGHQLSEQMDNLIADHQEVTRVVLHMDRLGRVDVTGAMELQQLLDEVHDQGLDTSIVDLTPTGRSIIGRVLCGDEYGVDLEEPPATMAMPGQLGGRTGRRP